MTTEKAPAAEAAQTQEEKFFGVTTTIDDMLPKKGDEKPEDKPEIVVEQDDDDDIKAAETPEKAKKVEAGASDEDVEKYSDKVQKRIDKLTWQFNEEKRQRVAAEAVKNEAIRAAQAINQKSQNYEHIIATGEATLVEQIKGRAAMAVENAKNVYRKAHEEGDTEAIISAQEAFTLAQAEQLEAFRYEGDYKNRVQNWQQQQQFAQQPQFQAPQQQVQQQVQPQQPQQPQVRKPTPESQTWVDKHDWFGKNEHRDMTAIAYAEHERLIRDDGVKPDTEEYYGKIDAKMRTMFPAYFKESKAPPTVVASGNRNNGAKPRTVRLKPSEVAVAKALGLTVEQYAKQTLKESR